LPGEQQYDDGAINAKGNVLGTYLHGIFNGRSFRDGFINALRRYHKLPDCNDYPIINREESYDRLAETVRLNLDMKKIYEIIEAGIK
jgi:adenosylcobyric acid synthase